MIYTEIHLICPACPWPSMALQYNIMAYNNILFSPGLMVEEDSDYVSSLQSLRSIPAWAQQLDRSRHLADCDLDLLTSDTEKWCFYVNLYNLMCLHAWYYATERELEEEEEDREEVGNGRMFSTWC